MTDDGVALAESRKKGVDQIFLREMIGLISERLMALETDSLCGAAPAERSAGRTNQRNGDRDWHIRVGKIERRIPKLDHGVYLMGFPEPRRMAEKALTTAWDWD